MEFEDVNTYHMTSHDMTPYHITPHHTLTALNIVYNIPCTQSLVCLNSSYTVEDGCVKDMERDPLTLQKLTPGSNSRPQCS